MWVRVPPGARTRNGYSSVPFFTSLSGVGTGFLFPVISIVWWLWWVKMALLLFTAAVIPSFWITAASFALNFENI